MSENTRLGHNDDGTVYCDLCEWSHAIASFEQAEAFLQTHLRDAHGKTLIYAVETETGVIKETPK